MKKELLAFAVCVATSALAGDLTPDPSKAYIGFVAINPPRVDVSVGALWIDHFGPTGAGAATDNVETVRSLSALSTDHQLQLSLTAGLLGLLGIDPHLCDHVSVHYADVSIVRVKDPIKLGGPPDAPHILEGLKVGSLSISSDHDLGVGATSSGWPAWASNCQVTADRSGQKTFEARDMFVALKVGFVRLIRSEPRQLRLDQGGHGAIDGYQIEVSSLPCPTAPCTSPRQLTIIPLTQFSSAASRTLVPFDQAGRASIDLPVPRADDQGGLYTKLEATLDPKCLATEPTQCRRLQVTLAGQRIEVVTKITGRGW